MEAQNQKDLQNDDHVQQVATRLSRLATLLKDLKQVVDEYWEMYRQEIDLGISSMNIYEHVDIECSNGYVLSFNPNTVYVYLKTPDKGGYRVLDYGKGMVGDVLSTPIECWDKLNEVVEDLIRRKIETIERLRRLYYVHTSTA
ncbi:MAG: hypothetical protein C0177_02735 [Fervidicoccus fontis]|nr:MAG: hypothetical protein C0177_02735 [Fervidicoccus fontis]